MPGPEKFGLKPAPIHRNAAVGLVLMVLAICAMRLPSLYEPIERDIGACMVIGFEMLQGRTIYSEIWEIKPPGLALTCTAGILAFGYEPHTVFLLGLIASIMTLLGVYYAASASGGGQATGLFAALFWTLMQSDVRMQANLPNTESFINICLIFSLGLLLRWPNESDKLQWKRSLLVGALFSVASMYKQVSVVFAAFLAIAHLFSYPARKRICEVVIMASVGALTWAMFFVLLKLCGIYQDYLDCGVRFIQTYAGSIGSNILNGLALQNAAPHFLLFMGPLALFSVLTIVLNWHLHRRMVLLLGASLLAAQVAMSLPGHFYPHYYQYWMPLLSVGAGWGVVSTAARWKTGISGILLRVLIGLAILLMGIYEALYYRMSPEQWSEMKYGSPFVSSRTLVPAIESLLEEDETFYNWGAECALYLYTQRPIPTSIFHFYPMLYESSVREKSEKKALTDLANQQPELAIIFKEATPSAHSFFDLRQRPVLKWVYDNYVPIPYGNKEFELRALKGGKLIGRLGIAHAGAASMPESGEE